MRIFCTQDEKCKIRKQLFKIVVFQNLSENRWCILIFFSLVGCDFMSWIGNRTKFYFLAVQARFYQRNETRFLIATYSQIYEWIQVILVSIASLCQRLNLPLRLWRRKPASCVPFSVFPIIYNFVYHRIENNTGISMCAVMKTRKTPILQANVTVSYVQEFVDSSISFILFLIKCTHCEFKRFVQFGN